jgi:hypothetical protein
MEPAALEVLREKKYAKGGAVHGKSALNKIKDTSQKR